LSNSGMGCEPGLGWVPKPYTTGDYPVSVQSVSFTNIKILVAFVYGSQK